MELYQLRTFVAVAREGSLTRAAESLFTSQPAVSAQIKALEAEFGLQLFERSPAGMTPTAAGEALWEEAERLLNGARDLTARAAALKGNVAGRLRLGFNNDDGVIRSTELLARLAAAHAELSFEVAYGSSGTVLAGVQNRELDAGFYEGTCEDAGVELVTLTHFDVVIVTPQAWAAELDRADWRLLSSKPWVFSSPHCSYFGVVQRLTAQHEVSPQARFQVDGDSTALQLAAAGHAITMTTEQVLRHHQLTASPALKIWPHFRQKMPLSLVYLASRRDDPLIVALREESARIWSAAPSPAPRP